jgi:hypothetical protein
MIFFSFFRGLTRVGKIRLKQNTLGCHHRHLGGSQFFFNNLREDVFGIDSALVLDQGCL